MKGGPAARRFLAAVGLTLAGLSVLPAEAQDGYAGGWTDPGPATEREGKPLAYLDSHRPLHGQVSHPNGIQSVNVVLVGAGSGECGVDGGSVDNAADGTGQQVSFRFDVSFPCNQVYEVRATAHAAEDPGIGGGRPPAYAMPLLVAVAIPPQPVSVVEATLTVDETNSDREVALSWPENSEPDLLGYVVTRVVDGDRDTLGQVDAGADTTFVDRAPPAGETVVYEVTAVRHGPDDTIDQVPTTPTAVSVDVPAPPEPESDDGDGDGSDAGGRGGDGDSGDGLTSASTATTQAGSSPRPGGLTSVRTRGSAPPRQGPPTTLDTGFGETLPFEVPEGGNEVAAPPVGGAAVVAEFEFDDSDSPLQNRETMALIAGGLALFVGALVIVYVTRRAASLSY